MIKLKKRSKKSGKRSQRKPPLSTQKEVVQLLRKKGNVLRIALAGTSCPFIYKEGEFDLEKFTQIRLSLFFKMRCSDKFKVKRRVCNDRYKYIDYVLAKRRGK